MSAKHAAKSARLQSGRFWRNVERSGLSVHPRDHVWLRPKLAARFLNGASEKLSLPAITDAAKERAGERCYDAIYRRASRRGGEHVAL